MLWSLCWFTVSPNSLRRWHQNRADKLFRGSFPATLSSRPAHIRSHVKPDVSTPDSFILALIAIYTDPFTILPLHWSPLFIPPLVYSQCERTGRVLGNHSHILQVCLAFSYLVPILPSPTATHTFIVPSLPYQSNFNYKQLHVIYFV